MKHFHISGTWSSLLTLWMSIIVLTNCLAVDPEGGTPQIRSERAAIRKYLEVVHSLDEIKMSVREFSNLPSVAGADRREEALNEVRLTIKDVSYKQDMFVAYAARTKFPEKVAPMVQSLVAALSDKSFINERAEVLNNLNNSDISQLTRIYQLFLKLPMPSKEDILYCQHYGLTSLNSF
jgi:hypothetical protein